MYELGKTIWSDDHPELYGEALDFEALANVKSNELLLYDDDATEPFGGVVCTLAEYTEHGVLLDTGGEKLTAVDRDELEEEAGIWRLDISRESTEEMPMKETEMKPDENASETVPMLTEKQQAEALHKQITGYGEVIYQSLYGMCTAIKQMRDSKLYKALGHSTFESYAQEMLGMTARQAYTYISIADKLSEDFVKSTSQIGIQKLYLLAMAPEETRAELTQTVDLESTTVRELKAQISALQSQNADTEKARVDAEERAQGWYDKYSEQGEQIASLNAQIAEQSERIDELESRPVEVAVPEPSHEVQNMQDAMRRMNLEHEQWSAKMQDDHIRHVQEINRQHRAETDALRAEYEEKLAAAQNAESPAPDEKEIFKAYLANAIDAAKRMTAFLQSHPNEACRKQAEKFFQTMIGEVST